MTTEERVLDPDTPVLVGVGLVSQREDNPRTAAEPIDLMIEAARRAGGDCGASQLLEHIDRVLVPVGRWSYANPGGMVAAAVGSPHAYSVSAVPGVSQQTLLSDASAAIAAGEISTALVVGGEAGYRLLRARIEGIEVENRDTHGAADVVLKPHDEILPAYERERGLGVMPVSYYAVIDTAWCHANGVAMDERRRRMAALYHGFSETAAANPHGWDIEAVSARSIQDARMLAFPYGKHHVSNWSVDQASALLLTSVAEARDRGIPRSKWIFPQAASEANHMVNVSARADLHRSVGAELAARAVLDASGCSAEDLDFVELYTCFPIAVDLYAEALGISERVDWSFTGAMPFAGGPLNNFVLHTTAQLAEHLRSSPGRGLVTTVSGLMTKQGFAVWGSDPNPDGYRLEDVTAQTAAATEVCDIDADYQGAALVAGYTVVHGRQGPDTGVAVVNLPDGRRSVASTTDPASMALMESTDFCAQQVRVDGPDLHVQA